MWEIQNFLGNILSILTTLVSRFAQPWAGASVKTVMSPKETAIRHSFSRECVALATFVIACVCYVVDLFVVVFFLVVYGRGRFFHGKNLGATAPPLLHSLVDSRHCVEGVVDDGKISRLLWTLGILLRFLFLHTPFLASQSRQTLQNLTHCYQTCPA